MQPRALTSRTSRHRDEIESAFLALRHTLLDGRVLRSGDRPGIEQELWVLLTHSQGFGVYDEDGGEPGNALSSMTKNSSGARGTTRQS